MSRSWVVLFACCMLSAAAVRANDNPDAQPARAQALFEQGLQLSADERWADARAAFLESARLTPRASTYFNLAVSSLELGLGRATLDALERFDALSDPLVHADYRKRAVELRQRALARVGTLELSIAPAEAQLEIDGIADPTTGASRVVLLEPGSHVVRISALGHETRTVEITIRARDTAHHSVELAQLVPPAADGTATRAAPPAALAAAPAAAHAVARPASRSLWSRPLTWIVIGAIVAAGATTGILIATQDGTSNAYGGSTRKVF